MEPFQRISGRVAPFMTANVDTDVIMPKTFLKGIDRKGLDVGVFNLLRFTNGSANPDFILNRPEWNGSAFLVVGPNFGCGSSREHAVWGLSQLGIRALIGTTFAGIFDDNCRNNGLLTIKLSAELIDQVAGVASDPTTNRMTVDLAAQQVILDDVGEEIGFDIEPARKAALLGGLDAVGVTLADVKSIRDFEARYRRACPWLFQR